MYSAANENTLIIVDIVDTMVEYTSIQPDIDENKMKAAEKVAQQLDIGRVIGAANVSRCIEPQDEDDDKLRELIIPPLCYFTYMRALKMFQGVLTDGGYTTETEASDLNSAKSQANNFQSIAEAFMEPVMEFLNGESNTDVVPLEEPTPRIRVFGGEENRASN